MWMMYQLTEVRDGNGARISGSRLALGQNVHPCGMGTGTGEDINPQVGTEMGTGTWINFHVIPIHASLLY